MASSFSSQIPTIIYLIQQIKPKSILDIGKGFGKYGFLIHEYIGIDNKKQLNANLTMAQQSRISIDAIEVDTDLLLPHLSHLYNNVLVGDVFDIYPKLDSYDLVLMIDVIEHLDKMKALEMLKYFISTGTDVIVATPIHFFHQNLYESEYENHISHWVIKDFQQIAYVDCQYFDAGAVYFLSPEKKKINGFGNYFFKKLKRIFRSIRNEI
jgi:2-polyprenyl-3-methyl-5-hydroxy-6-metoxy-1,4-benzoquinol methylase